MASVTTWTLYFARVEMAAGMADFSSLFVTWNLMFARPFIPALGI